METGAIHVLHVPVYVEHQHQLPQAVCVYMYNRSCSIYIKELHRCIVADVVVSVV